MYYFIIYVSEEEEEPEKNEQKKKSFYWREHETVCSVHYLYLFCLFSFLSFISYFVVNFNALKFYWSKWFYYRHYNFPLCSFFGLIIIVGQNSRRKIHGNVPNPPRRPTTLIRFFQAHHIQIPKSYRLLSKFCSSSHHFFFHSRWRFY